ncbi:MAG: hypothetical protein ACXWPS_10145 [Ktedonobacteraceae bacterium]
MRNPWTDLPTTAPFVLPCDKQAIVTFNASAKPDHTIHTEVLPAPFVGNPAAPIVFLNLNPGYTKQHEQFVVDEYCNQATRANLVHASQDYPFYVLDPRIGSNPGYRYWTRILKPLIVLYGLKKIANEVCVVELFPYHSEHFAGKLCVPSQTYSWYLIQEAMRRNALIIQMRSRRLWQKAILELVSYPNYYCVNSPQNPTLSAKNSPKGFPEMVKVLG